MVKNSTGFIKMTFDASVGIIGAGPLGLELAIALHEAGVSYLQFEKGQVAQMISNFPSQTHFFSSNERIGIAGIPIQTVDQQKCSREEYLAYIRSVVMQHNLKVNTYEEVVHIESIGSEGFILKTLSAKGERKYRTQYLILAIGGTSSPRKLGVEGENLPHVSIKMEDPHTYFQKKVLVIGGKNSAVESALRCFHAGASVSIALLNPKFEPGDAKYWLLPELLGRIERGEIQCYYDSEVTAIQKDRVILKRKSDGALYDVLTDFVIKAIGFQADMRFFHQLDISLDEEGRPIFDENMETSKKRVFVLGTIVGGTQKRYRVFIENTHQHVAKIIYALCREMQIECPKIKFIEKIESKPTSATRLEE